jgi:glycosyltransferase involved in cell wall biosynthesis
LKNILAINTANSGGGAENVAYTLCREMHRRGFVSRLMASRIDYSADALAQELVVPIPGERFLYSAGNLLDDLTSMQYLWYLPTYMLPFSRNFTYADVVHLHNLHGNYFNPRVLPAVFRKKPVVWTIHDMWPFTGKCVASFGCTRYREECGNCPHLDAYPSMKRDLSAYHLRLKRRCVEGASFLVVAPSDWMRMHVATSLLKDQPVMVIPSPVDTSIFHPEPKEEVRARLGIPLEKQVVMFVASVIDGNEAKGANVLRGMLASLRSKFPDLYVLIVGETKGTSIIGAGVEGRQTGWVSDRSLMRSYYSTADLLIAPTMAENSPCTVVEAMACGTPVAAYAVGGIPEQITNRKTGVLVEPGDLKGLTAAVASFLDDPEKSVSFGKSAAAAVKERFSLEYCAGQYIKAYEESIRLNGSATQIEDSPRS